MRLTTPLSSMPSMALRSAGPRRDVAGRRRRTVIRCHDVRAGVGDVRDRDGSVDTVAEADLARGAVQHVVLAARRTRRNRRLGPDLGAVALVDGVMRVRQPGLVEPERLVASAAVLPSTSSRTVSI
jgi:hypothetical protein